MCLFLLAICRDRNGMSGSYGNSMLKGQTVFFQSSCIICHSYRQSVRMPASPCLCQHFLSQIVSGYSHPEGGKWHLTVVSICNSLISNEAEHLFKWPLYILFREMSIQILCPFLNWSICLLLGCKNSLYNLDVSFLLETSFANIFSHSAVVVGFLLLWWCPSMY